MFHPLRCSDDAYSEQIFKQNANAVVKLNFIPFAVTKQKYVFLERS